MLAITRSFPKCVLQIVFRCYSCNTMYVHHQTVNQIGDIRWNEPMISRSKLFTDDRCVSIPFIKMNLALFTVSQSQVTNNSQPNLKFNMFK